MFTDHEAAARRADRKLNCIETGKQLNIHPRTIARMVKRGELKAIRLGRCIRIMQSEVDRVLAGK
jgi:excisionase family DNA binding protein